MSQIVELIEAAREKRGLPSDNALANALGIGRAHISNYRKGYCSPKAYVVLRLAEMAGEDPAKAIAEVAAEREKHPERRRWLENFRTAACWAAMTLVTTFVTAPETSHAESTTYDVSKVGNTNYRGFWRRLRTALSRLAGIVKAAPPRPRFAG